MWICSSWSVLKGSNFPTRGIFRWHSCCCFARLPATGANILLLDEPFGALDEFTRERLNTELLKIHDIGATTLFVTHNIAEAIFLADEVLVMTPRPGRLARVINVPFEHPRHIGLMRSPEFNDLVFEVREILGADQ